MKVNEMFNGVFDQTYNRFTSFIFGTLGFEDIVKATVDSDPIVKRYVAVNKGLGVTPENSRRNIENTFYYQYLQYFENTRSVYDKMLTIRRHYLVKAILTTLINDALATDPNTNQIFQINISQDYKKSSKAEKACNDFMEKFQIEKLLLDTAWDTIFYGEYYFENFGSKKKGITGIADSNPPGSVFAQYQGASPEFYFRLNKNTAGMTTSQELTKVDKANIWHISVFPRQLKLSLGGSGSTIVYSQKDYQISSYLRVGEPLFYDCYDKVVELEALEQSQLAKILGDLLRNAIISVDAPAGLDLKGLKELTLWYEKVLNDNDNINIDSIQNLATVRSMMANLSKARVIPRQPDRGTMSQIDVKTYDGSGTKDTIEDRRSVICTTIGVPFEFLFESRDPSKTSLRQYVRYSRLVKMIQRGYQDSIRDELLTHLHTLDGFEDIQLKDIEVKCYNAINVSELDKLEFADATVSMVGSFRSFIEDLATTKIGKYVNLLELGRYLEKVIDTIPGAEHIIDIPEDAKPIYGVDDEDEGDITGDHFYNAGQSGDDRHTRIEHSSKKHDDTDKKSSEETTTSKSTTVGD